MRGFFRARGRSYADFPEVKERALSLQVCVRVCLCVLLPHRVIRSGRNAHMKGIDAPGNSTASLVGDTFAVVSVHDAYRSNFTVRRQWWRRRRARSEGVSEAPLCIDGRFRRLLELCLVTLDEWCANFKRLS